MHKESETALQSQQFLNESKFQKKLFQGTLNNLNNYAPSKAICASVFLLFSNTRLWLQNNMWSFLYAHPAA